MGAEECLKLKVLLVCPINVFRHAHNSRHALLLLPLLSLLLLLLVVLAGGAEPAASYAHHLGLHPLARAVACGLAGAAGTVELRRDPVDSTLHAGLPSGVHICGRAGWTAGPGWWYYHGEPGLWCTQFGSKDPV